MLKIRLSRGGRKALPFYRILVTDSSSPRDSKFLEKVGLYNPLLTDDNEKRIIIDKERAEYWLSVGAQPSDKVAKFLISLGIKGSEKHKPNFKSKASGTGLKKKALEKVKKEIEAKAKATADAIAAEAKKSEATA